MQMAAFSYKNKMAAITKMDVMCQFCCGKLNLKIPEIHTVVYSLKC